MGVDDYKSGKAGKSAAFPPDGKFPVLYDKSLLTPSTYFASRIEEIGLAMNIGMADAAFILKDRVVGEINQGLDELLEKVPEYR